MFSFFLTLFIYFLKTGFWFGVLKKEVKRKKMEKMRIRMIGACLIVFLFVVLSLSDTINAQIGPPIGVQNVEFIPSGPLLLEQEVTVNITWWITHPDYQNYTGPFELKIGLKNIDDGTEEKDWKIPDNNITFDYESSESNPYYYNFTKVAPDQIGNYSLELQILATNLTKEVGKSGNVHSFLVASGEEPITTVPEFTTIAIPVVAILGLLFFFNHRKRRKN